MRLSLAYRRFSPNHSSIATQISSPIGPISFLPSSRNSSAGASRPLLSFQDIPAPHLGSIRILSLNSPHNRNAISQRLLSDLKFQIDSLAQSGDGSKGGIRALIIASTLDNVFCAGADLKERKGMSDQETARFLSTLRNALTTLSALPIPTLSAISSMALGGGFELALATTFRVCAPSAVLGLPETRLGIVPGAGGTYRLRKLVGEARALDLILTGRRISGSLAEKIGACEFVVDMEKDDDQGRVREKVLDMAVGIARNVCEGGPVSVGAAMRAVKGGDEGDEAVEDREYRACLERGREDRDEALKAFAEKREVKFRGEGGGYG